MTNDDLLQVCSKKVVIGGHYSAIAPYVKPFFPLDLPRWLITALTPVDKIDNEVF
jgi:hypothetical protein